MSHDRTIHIPPPSTPAPTGILKVQGRDIVGQDGQPVILKGAGLGGHLNMENFITYASGFAFFKLRRDLTLDCVSADIQATRNI